MKILSASLLSVLCLAFTVPSLAADYCGRFGFDSTAGTAALAYKPSGFVGPAQVLSVNLSSDVIQSLDLEEGACVCLGGKLKKSYALPYLDPTLAKVIPDQECKDAGL
jgi:hypothetical protein